MHEGGLNCNYSYYTKMKKNLRHAHIARHSYRKVG